MAYMDSYFSNYLYRCECCCINTIPHYSYTTGSRKCAQCLKSEISMNDVNFRYGRCKDCHVLLPYDTLNQQCEKCENVRKDFYRTLLRK